MTGLTNYSVGEYIWKSVIASFIGNFIGAVSSRPETLFDFLG